MKKKYRLLYGSHYELTENGRVVHVEGDIVELSERQAISFKDKFEPVDGSIAPNEEAREEKLKVIHLGFGKYNVIKVKTGKTINDMPLNKKEAYNLLEGGIDVEREAEDREDTEEEPPKDEAEAAEDPKVDTAKDVAEPRRVPTRRRAESKSSRSKPTRRKTIDRQKKK